MKKLLVLLVVVLAVWYGWKHYPDLVNRRPGHEAVVENASGKRIERIRLIVGGQTFVKDALEDGEKAVFSFKVDNDASFKLVWQAERSDVESSWSGGMVPRGPMLQRHIMSIDGENNVLYRAENK